MPATHSWVQHCFVSPAPAAACLAFSCTLRRYLYCPKGTKFEGRFAMTHMNNWQHTASYPGVVLSGLVDLLALVVPLPSGTSQVRESG